MITNKIGYSYNDLTIVPARVSNISSRSEVNPFNYGILPIFTSPMSTIVCEENFEFWENNKITPILPRNISFDIRKKYIRDGYWVAMSMKESEDLFIKSTEMDDIFACSLCIDVANGHMNSLINLCKDIKKKFGNRIIIMTGNIANPDTIIDYENAGIDYVRCSIGSGAGCLTAPQTSVHYPIASLIDQCRTIKNVNNLKIKIVADGGIRNYGDVIKALALGADYVMIGSVFASLYESAAEFLIDNGYNTAEDNELIKRTIISEYKPKKVFYGMSTKKAQKLIKPDTETLKTSEGLEKLLNCTHTMKQWSENMEAYLRSAMSYCNAKSLKDFIGKVNLIPNSPAEINAVNK